MQCIACKKPACVSVQQTLPREARCGDNLVFYYYCKEDYEKIYNHP
jgi:hypothetical protein